MAQIVFVHGWGFDDSIWADVAEKFPNDDCHMVNLGFFGAEKTEIDGLEAPLVVTHSMGLLWALRHIPQPWAGVLSFNGFTRYTADKDWADGISPRVLKLMQKGFENGPDLVWENFMSKAGMISPSFDQSAADVAALAQGLAQLSSWDGRDAWQALSCKKINVCTIGDQIVPLALSRASFQSDLICLEGDHLLPISDRQACVAQINEFKDQVHG